MFKFGLLAIYFLPVSVVMVILNIAKPDVDYCGECIDWCSHKSILAYINLGIIVYAIGTLFVLFDKKDNAADNDTKVEKIKQYEYDYIPTMATLLAFVAFDYSDIRSIAVFVFMLLFLYLIISSTPICYSSPIYPIMGFIIYKGNIGDKEVVIITREKINVDSCRFCYIKVTDTIYYLCKNN